jgi:hypothetical protein
MFRIFDLPSDVVVPVLCRWIDMRSTGRFDFACCSHNSRPPLLRIFASSAFIHRTMYVPGCSEHTINHLLWLLQRQMKVAEWRIKDNIKPLLAQRLVNTVSGAHVRSVNLGRLSNQLITMMLDGVHRGPRKVSELDVRCISPILAHLVDIRLMDVNDDVLYAVRQHANNLQVLVIQHSCNYSMEALHFLIQRCNDLRVLSLHRSYRCGFINAFADVVVSSSTMKGLHLSSAQSTTNFLYASTMEGLATKCGATLKYLSLGYIECVEEDGLSAVVEHCTNIQELHLNIPRFQRIAIPAGCYVKLLSSLPCLQELILECCVNVADVVLRAIADHAPNLTVLGLHQSDGYSVYGALKLIQALPSLQTLGLHPHHALFKELLLVRVVSSRGLRVTARAITTSFSLELHSGP